MDHTPLAPRVVQAVANRIADDRRLRRPTNYRLIARDYGITVRQARKIGKGQIRPIKPPATRHPPLATES